VAEVATAQGHTLLTHPLGLHARPAVRLAQLAARFQAEVFMRIDDQGEWVSTRSAAQLMRLRARPNSVVCFRAEGEDARDAVVEMVALVDRDFDDSLRGEWTVPATVASPGLATGSLWTLPPPPPPAVSETASPAGERQRLQQALDAVAGALRQLAARVEPLGARILEWQLALLADPALLEPLWRGLAAGMSAGAAWRAQLDTFSQQYRDVKDEYFRSRGLDLRDLGERVQQQLDGVVPPTPDSGDILFCTELAPSRFLALDPARLRGVVLAEGSVVSHVAMLARHRGVPMLVRPRLDPRQLSAGCEVVVDADGGRLILNPKVTTMTRYSKTLTVRAMEAAVAEQFLMDPGQTGEGEPVRIGLDVSEAMELDAVAPAHCDGIGRARSEMLFARDGLPPDEEVQLRRYRRLLAWAGDRPVSIATLDPDTLPATAGAGVEPQQAAALARLRGVRLLLACPELFRAQLRALCRAAVDGDLRVLLPMVSSPAELEQVRALLETTVADLHAAGCAARMPGLGLLLAVPAAAWSLEHFPISAVTVDLDGLVGYLFAAEGDAPQLAELRDPTHPAVLALLRGVVQQAGARGMELAICGDLLSYPDYLRQLLAVGIRALVVPPGQLARIKAKLVEC